VRVGFDVFVVSAEDAEEEEVFGVVNCFDNEPVVAGEIEEGSGFSG
jgi:hypothetical protein